MAWLDKRNNGYYYIYWYEGQTPCGKPAKHMKSLKTKNAARARIVYKLFEEKIYFKKQGFTTLDKMEIDVFMPRLASYLRANFENVLTRNKYFGNYKEFANFMNEKYRYIRHLQEVKDTHIAAFKEYERAKNKSPHTINGELTSLGKVFKIAKELNHINENPVKGVSRIKAAKPAIELYTQDEIRLMLKYSKENPMLEVLILLLLQAAPRRQEIVNFKWSDFYKENMTLKVSRKEGWNPKKDKERILKLSNRLTEMLNNLERKSDYIFTQQEGRNKGNKFSNSGIYRYIVPRFLKRLAIEGDMHKFRDTYASYSIACGVDVAKVQWRLAHESLKETDKYAMAINEPIEDDIKVIFVGEKRELT